MKSYWVGGLAVSMLLASQALGQEIFTQEISDETRCGVSVGEDAQWPFCQSEADGVLLKCFGPSKIAVAIQEAENGQCLLSDGNIVEKVGSYAEPPKSTSYENLFAERERRQAAECLFSNIVNPTAYEMLRNGEVIVKGRDSQKTIDVSDQVAEMEDACKDHIPAR